MDDETRRQRLFEDRIRASHPAVLSVAALLHSWGFLIHVPNLRISPGIKDNHDYRDRGDIYVDTAGVAEVKYVRKHAFHDQVSYERKYPTLLIAKADDFDAKHPAPWAYFFVSKDYSTAAYLPVSVTRHEWWEVQQDDPERGNTYRAYRTNVCLARFYPLTRASARTPDRPQQ